MHTEAPEFRRCCFCLPLRRGLMAWGYTKLVLNISTIAYFVFITPMFLSHFTIRALFIVTLVFGSLLIDTCFNMIFIVAGHKKCVKLLKISYIYNIVWLAVLGIGSCILLYKNLHRVYVMWKYSEIRIYLVGEFLFCAGLEFILIFVQIYVILLIRSEMAKLRGQTLEIQYSKHLATGEPQCTLRSGSVADRCEGKKPVV